jgi:hypothetical protein
VGDRRTRTIVALVAVALVAGVAAFAWAASRPRTGDEQVALARELFAQVDATAEVTASSLGVTHAPADFGLEEGIRTVPVRIVEELTIAVRLDTARDVLMAGPPRVCLVGPFWNPLDAGLSDRCWGEPDLGALVGERLVANAVGHVVLRPDEPITLAVTLERGDARCDYAPGEWRFQVDAVPVVDGAEQPRQDLADVPLTLPLETGGDLPYRPPAETRVCSYTAAVYVRQGEPSFVED